MIAMRCLVPRSLDQKIWCPLEYTPEDTLKSAIFINRENALTSEEKPIVVTSICSNDDELKVSLSQFDLKNSSQPYFTDNDDHPIPNGSQNETAKVDGKIQTEQSEILQSSTFENPRSIQDESSGSERSRTTNGDGDSVFVGGKQPSKRRMNPKRPAPFLKRRQGVSAWCSKIRKQGQPITDPARELLTRQCANSLQKPVVQDCSASEQSKSEDSKSLPTKMNNSLSSQLNDKKQIFSLCESSRNKLKPKVSSLHYMNTDSVDLDKDDVKKLKRETTTTTTSGRNDNLIENDDNNAYSYQNSTHLLAKSTVNSPDLQTSINHLSVELMNINLNESHKEAIDLQEFELLEEFAETSSFSSLPTIFISRLNKMNLCLQNNQKEYKKEAFETDQSSSKCNPIDLLKDEKPISLVQLHSKHDYTSIEDYNNLHNKVNFKTTNTQAINLINTSNILGSNNDTNIMNKRCKVTPSHLIKTSVQTSLEKSNDQQSISRGQFNSVPSSNHYDFDDTQSWSFSASELNDPKISSRFDLSESSLINCGDFVNQPNESIVLHPTSLSASNETNSYLPYHNAEKLQGMISVVRAPNAYETFSETDKQKKISVVPHDEDDLVKSTDDFVGSFKEEPNNSIGQETSAVAPVGNDQSVLKHWINQLEIEIKRFKVENANLNKLKIEVQNNLRQIELEKNCFINNKMKEQKEFEEYKEAEMKKLKKEKRVLEEYRRALRTMPNKKDREEIERLKQELEESRTDMGKREVRWHSALSRLRTRIEELETERDELKSRIIRLAKLQISSNTSNPSRQRSSSLRQTINSISQSISLAPSVNGTNLKTTSDTYHRSRQPPCTRSSSSQQQHYLVLFQD
ncbi:unnamed protein product [Heterobilharzia americana]|nr:unnamed protein product [Heterobilharzia americana]